MRVRVRLLLGAPNIFVRVVKVGKHNRLKHVSMRVRLLSRTPIKVTVYLVCSAEQKNNGAGMASLESYNSRMLDMRLFIVSFTPSLSSRLSLDG